MSSTTDECDAHQCHCGSSWCLYGYGRFEELRRDLQELGVAVQTIEQPRVKLFHGASMVTLDARGRISATALRESLGLLPMAFRGVGLTVVLLPYEQARQVSGVPGGHLIPGVGVGPLKWTPTVRNRSAWRLTLPRVLREWAALIPGADVYIEGLPSGGVLIADAEQLRADLLDLNEQLLRNLVRERGGRYV